MSVQWELMCATLRAVGKEQPPGTGEMIANTLVIMTIGKIVDSRRFEKLTERLEREATPAKALLADQMSARQAENYAMMGMRK